MLRVAWNDFPSVILHTNASTLKGQPDYLAAKNGDFPAAFRVAQACLKFDKVPSGVEYIVPVMQFDRSAMNAIPWAVATVLAAELGCKVWSDIQQFNEVFHTGADAHTRITGQPVFVGEAPPGKCLLIDDVVTYGSTLANLRGHINQNGGLVTHASCLASGTFGSTKLVPDDNLIETLRKNYGYDLTRLCTKLGFKAECFTGCEAHYLAGLKTVERFRTTFHEAIGASRFKIGPR